MATMQATKQIARGAAKLLPKSTVPHGLSARNATAGNAGLVNRMHEQLYPHLYKPNSSYIPEKSNKKPSLRKHKRDENQHILNEKEMKWTKEDMPAEAEKIQPPKKYIQRGVDPASMSFCSHSGL